MKKCTERVWQSNLLHLCFGLLLMLAAYSASAQDPPQYGTPYSGVPDPRDVNMYQVHTRIFSSGGNFQGVISRLSNIRNLGVNTIYLMPHYTIGTDSRASGSPYCIKDFKGVDPEYGTLTDLRQLVDDAHTLGMAVILDFVVNQTSFDHPWITQHPDWYQHDGAGNIVALFPDVAALDMNNVNVQNAMIEAMRYWIFAANVDGFRCDFANNAPVSFWTAVIGNLRGITTHKLLMLAEGDRVENFQGGFDFNFGDKFFWDALRPISSGTSLAQLQTTTDTEYSLATGTQQVVRYTTNHDLVGRNDINVKPFDVFVNHNGVVANFLVCAFMRGVPFLMSGQEVDFTSFVPYPWRTPKIDWSVNTTAAADFTKILNFRTNSAAIRRGTMTNYSNTNVCAFTKITGSEKVVVLVNLRNSTQSFVIPSAMAGTYTNAFATGTQVTLTNGATQSLGAFQYLVLTNTSSCTPTAITPYVSVNGGAWTQTSTASLTAGGSVAFGPQPTTGGSWSWSGPNGYSATTREITLTNVQTNQSGNYVATYTNDSGCQSTQTFSLTVNAPPSNVPSPWLTADIGAVGAAGSANYANSIFTLNASGADVFDFADEVRFVYQSYSGNVTVTAKVESLTNTNAWAKAGVMIRETLDANATNASMLLTPSNGFNFQYRNGTGAGSTAAGSGAGTIPNWVRITRSGNTITAYSSTNGTSWTSVGSLTITLPSSVYIGLFATSHNDGVITTATFSNVTVTAGANNPPTANAGPDKSLTAGTTSTTLPGSGSDPDGTAVTYSWTKVSGPAVTLSNANTATLSVSGLTNGSTYVFQLTVSDGVLTASDQVQVTVSNTTQYYAIRNRWQNNYLYDAGANVGYGATVANNNYRWEKVAVDATNFRLRNVGTGEYMHIENQTGSVQCTAITLDWWSAQWYSQSVDATYVRIRNRWQNASMIHIENLTGSAQYAGAQDGWYSAQWELVPNGSSSGRMRTAVAEEEVEEEKVFAIYPNPSSGNRFTIVVPVMKEGQAADATIFDISGKAIWQKTLVKTEEVKHDFKPGMYVVRVHAPVGVWVSKVIVR